MSNNDSQHNETLNATVSDIQSILDRLDMTVFNPPDQMDFTMGGKSGIGNELWNKKVNFESKFLLKNQGLGIFEKLCDKVNYEQEGICHISKRADNLKNWY